MSIPSIIHLRPSRHLINPKFDGYKLSLEPVPVLKTPLASSPQRRHTNEDQYTFLHAKLYSLHNLLVKDPWHSYSFYYLDDNWTIQNVKYDSGSGQIQPIRAVFKLSRPNTGNADYNPSFIFLSEKYCVFSDGCGTLRIIDTGDRYRGEEWKGLYGDQALEDASRFIVQDARLEFNEGVRQIHCLLLRVHQNVTAEEQGFEAVLDWLVLEKKTNDSSWTKTHAKQLRGKSLPEYCALEPRCKSILLASDRKWEFAFDIEHPIIADESHEKLEANEENMSEVLNAISFTWNQTDEDVVIHFNISRDCNKNDIKVICNGTKIQVMHKNDALLNADLYDRIDNDLTTWSLENEMLQVTLVKAIADKMWKSLLSDIDIEASETPAQAIRDLSQPPTSTLRTEMEDCDFGDSDIESEFFLERIDSTIHKATHKVNLGQNNPPLFILPLRPGQPPAVAIRNDVDVCLWLPQLNTAPLTEPDTVNWALQHEGTINAFGYIQASKQQKKYLKSSPDMSYAVICEPHRHVFIYKMGHAGASGLKNRNSGSTVCLGQQKLVTMDESDEVVGISVEDDVTLMLTQKNIVCLQINA